MRLLLDENLPRSLKPHFDPETEVWTVVERGWSGKSNGELLTLAQDDFDVFLTMDQGIEYQQNLQGKSIGLVVIRAPSNRIENLQPLMPKINGALETIQPGTVVRVEP